MHGPKVPSAVAKPYPQSTSVQMFGTDVMCRLRSGNGRALRDCYVRRRYVPPRPRLGGAIIRDHGRCRFVANEMH
jgi:hypothetical protein